MQWPNTGCYAYLRPLATVAMLNTIFLEWFMITIYVPNFMKIGWELWPLGVIKENMKMMMMMKKWKIKKTRFLTSYISASTEPILMIFSQDIYVGIKSLNCEFHSILCNTWHGTTKKPVLAIFANFTGEQLLVET